MAILTAENALNLTTTLRQLEETDDALPNLWNPAFQTLLNNDKHLKNQIGNLKANGGVTDAMIGNRTVNTRTTAPVLTGTISQLFEGVVGQIARITGESSWLTAPPTSLKTLNALAERVAFFEIYIKRIENSSTGVDYYQSEEVVWQSGKKIDFRLSGKRTGGLNVDIEFSHSGLARSGLGTQAPMIFLHLNELDDENLITDITIRDIQGDNKVELAFTIKDTLQLRAARVFGLAFDIHGLDGIRPFIPDS